MAEFASKGVAGTGFTDGHGKITFIPVQVVADRCYGFLRGHL